MNPTLPLPRPVGLGNVRGNPPAAVPVAVHGTPAPVPPRLPCPPMTTAESEARRALNRLARALEKSRRELDALAGSIRHAEGDDFPGDAYRDAEDRLARLLEFVEEEGGRLQEKVLRSGGLEPGRVRRSSSS